MSTANQTILNALKSQSQLKRKELDQYRTDVIDKAILAQTEIVHTWLKDNVSPKIGVISASTERLEIMKASNQYNGWAASTIYLNTDWQNKTTKTKYAKLSWYSTTAKSDDANILLDVEIFGALASKFSLIEYEFVNNWSPTFQDIYNPLSDMESEIYAIDRSIRQIESDIRTGELNRYKQPGFSCTLNKELSIERNWESEDKHYELLEKDHGAQLIIGRSKWAYLNVISFKVIKTNKYKTTLEVISLNLTEPAIYEVTANKFESFIEEVFYWQNGKSESQNAETKDRFAKRYCNIAA